MIRTISCIVLAAVLAGIGCNTSGTNQATPGPGASAAQVASPTLFHQASACSSRASTCSTATWSI